MKITGKPKAGTIRFLFLVNMTEIRTFPGVGRIESTGYACLKIILTFLGPKNRPALDPPFSCAAVAKGSIEEIICQSPSLSEMDLALNGAYKQALVEIEQ